MTPVDSATDEVLIFVASRGLTYVQPWLRLQMIWRQCSGLCTYIWHTSQVHREAWHHFVRMAHHACCLR